MNGMYTSTPILPPGFRFHPTDQELIVYYLRKKISYSTSPEVSTIADVNIYKFNPWELPAKALFGENEWFFFSPRDRKYPNGARPNRSAASGYWKATGTDKPILTTKGSQCLGVTKALVFYRGRPPKGTKTNWVMLEYRMLYDSHQPQKLRGSMRLDDWVLCRVRQKTNNNLHQKEKTYYSSCGSYSPFTRGCLQGQEIKRKNNTFQDYDLDFQACLLPPLQNKQADEDCQEGCPKHSMTTEEYNSQPTTVSSLKEALESIKKVLSIGALEELVPVPKKRLHVATSDTPENTSMFQVSSPPTHPWSLSGFMI